MNPRYWYRPEVGPQPPIILISTNLGLGLWDRPVHVTFKGPAGGLFNCGIEPILRVIDLMQEPHRTKLLASAECHYGLPLGSMMGPEFVPVEERCGA